MDDRGPRVREVWGIWLVFVALVLALVWKLMYWPIWSTDQGLSMHILLTFVTVQPLQFVLERVGPFGAILGIIGAYLIERGRVDGTYRVGIWWNRERLALAFAVGAEMAFLLTLGNVSALPIASWLLVRAATNLTVLIGLSLYLLWTAERFSGIFARKLAPAAFVSALFAAELDLWTWGLLFGHIDSLSVYPPLSVASALLGAVSLGIWILIYFAIVQRTRSLTPAIPPVADA